ncbi:PhzF family phenazine biosynthesis protein [Chromobacterium phragmitis]|nr:PhzF family phenazine biosynthesis protein [Chromobacterium phragmitis]
MALEIQAFRCFGTGPDSGNLALVCHGKAAERLSVAQRQQAARELGAPACVFVGPGSTPDEAATLDYYYPHARSALCLHASLAAAAWLEKRDGVLPASLRTAGGQRLKLEREEGRILFHLQAQAVLAAAPPRDWLAGALGCEAERIVSPPALASAGSPKLLVELAATEDLNRLSPNLARIVEWGRSTGVNGCYVYARLGEGRYQGRNFNHLDPALEDAATGVAAAALSLHLRRDLLLLQGGPLGNPCELSARWAEQWVAVGGVCREAA